MRGATPSRASEPAHRRTTHASERIALLRGWPPLAWEKCVQSGLACSQPTGLPATRRRGSACQTSSCRCRVYGWFAACMPIAAASWLMAMSGSRPRAWRRASLAPPPPANRSTTISPGRSRDAGSSRKPKPCWVPSATRDSLLAGGLGDGGVYLPDRVAVVPRVQIPRRKSARRKQVRGGGD